MSTSKHSPTFRTSVLPSSSTSSSSFLRIFDYQFLNNGHSADRVLGDLTLRNGSPKAAIAKCGTSNVFSAALLLIAQTRICPHSHKNITKFYVVLLAIQHEVSCQISTAIMVVFVNVAYWLTNRKVRRWLNDSTL